MSIEQLWFTLIMAAAIIAAPWTNNPVWSIRLLRFAFALNLILLGWLAVELY